jgi:3-methylfumaryl-CoA hydratase
VSHKAGRTGSLVFVTARFEFSDADGVAMSEERDIVYREPIEVVAGAPVVAPKRAPETAAWERVIHPDPVLLFRYSALTFNGHRIHYDQPFATQQEGYPGLIVHGPLLATLLVDLVRRQRPDAQIATFNFRAVSPLFDTADFAVCGEPSADGKTIKLWARGADGALAMDASATLV